ncbi:uncharacterized protein JCM10292_003616 [Rhodotorula paludigena]|uniref:uncharacterized protein n=1 Tax=Rhodotorula paludigena TaxID=86838 RepID=UPI0031707559
MARTSREYDDNDMALQQADEMPAEHDRRDSMSSASSTLAGHSRRPSTILGSSTPQGTSPRRRVLAYAVLVVLSSCAARNVARLARHSRQTTALFIVLHFALLAVLAVVLQYRRNKQRITSGGGAIELGRGGYGAAGSSGASGSTKQAMLAGLTIALALFCRVYESRFGDARFGEALEVYTIPAVLAIAPSLSLRTSNGHVWLASSPTSLLAACGGSTFLVGFALIGVAASGTTITLALLRVCMDAISLVLVKDGLAATDGRVLGFLSQAALFASGVSFAAVPASVAFASQDAMFGFDPAGYSSLASTLLFSVSAQVAVLIVLSSFPTPTTAAHSLLPRNLVLLACSTFGREGIPLRDNWIQELLVYFFGSITTAWADPELSAAVANLRAGESRYSTLNAHSAIPHSPTGASLLSSASHPPNHRKDSSDRALSGSSATPSIFSILPFVPLLLYLVTSPATTTKLSSGCAYLPPSVRARLCPLSDYALPVSRSVDLVVSYYNEDLNRTRNHLDHIRQSDFVAKRNNRIVLYNKGQRSEAELRKELELKWLDEVVPLENLGREGATYLSHILLHFNSTLASLSPAYEVTPPPPASLAKPLSHLRIKVLADHTYFLQPHLAWHWIAQPRLKEIAPETGFAHLGPYYNSSCGWDTRVNTSFPIAKELYNVFTGELCPPGGQLGAWSAQMVVSKRRILANPYGRYASVLSLLEAPAGHWIHDMWGPNESGGPSNPALGHSVERAWPVTFGCRDVRIAVECGDDVYERKKCQCLDV